MICENFSFAKCFFEWSVKVMMNKLIKRKAHVDKLKDYVNSDFVKVYIGSRQCGKTSLMHNITDEVKKMDER